MAFILSQSAAYFWPVSIDFPVDGGTFQTGVFDAEFRRLTQKRVEEIVNGIMSDDLDVAVAVNEIVCGWRGVTDGSGDLPFSVGALNQLLDIPGAGLSIIKAWMDSLNGAKRKN